MNLRPLRIIPDSHLSITRCLWRSQPIIFVVVQGTVVPLYLVKTYNILDKFVENENICNQNHYKNRSFSAQQMWCILNAHVYYTVVKSQLNNLILI